MLYELMRECRNYFPAESGPILGSFTVAGGSIDLPLAPNQYYLIEGSLFNDGLHKYAVTDELDDETWTGKIVPLAVPKAFLKLAERIDDWKDKYGENTPFTSESFNGYSYEKAIGQSGKQTSWKDAFATDIAIWRRL